jgi:Zn-dependent M28 family amino/carboxypeptidase
LSRIRTLTATATVVAAATAFVAGPASAAPKPDKGPDKAGSANSKAVDNRNNNTSEKLRQAASAQGGLEHLTAFQRIADANGGTRASGTPGYDASAEYVLSRLRAAGYTPEVQEFDFPYFQELAPATLTAGGTVLGTGSFTYSGAGTVTGNVVSVDVVVPPAAAPGSTSGCEASDFSAAAFAGPNDIALIQRGTCTFAVKALNAQNAGAEAVIIFNEGQAGRTDLLIGTLGAPDVTIPVVGASYADALALRAAGTATVTASTISENRTTVNIIAQTSGRTDNVVMVGAHLDSVIAGPGINDNGSGSAGILEVAEAYAKTKPTNAVRFAWWGAEELGLLGSEYYVDQLTEAEADDIALYLNFDMIASPNFARMVYDGDDSEKIGAPAGPEGSAQIEEVFTDFFTQRGLNSKATDFSGRSDYGPFIAVGIPSGGLFTGAEELANELDNRLFGSEIGVAYDPCYHIACDTLANLDLTVFEENIDAIAHAVIVYGYSTSTVNGEAGEEGKGLTKVSGPGGGIAAGESGTGGGGLREGHADHVGEDS